MSHSHYAKSIFDIELAGLRAVRGKLDKEFDAAVAEILDCLNQQGKIVVVGIGKSGNVGQKIAATLTSTGSTSVVLSSVDALHGDLGIVNDGDVILALSYSGESEEMVNLMPALRRFAVKVVSLTGDPKSTIARHSDVALNVKVPKEACPFNLAPTTSTTAMLVMGDALAMAVLKARGFTEEEYARYHPAGSIGRSLLLKVRDVMRTGDRNPVAAQTLSVKSGLMIMTKARAGCISVTNKAGKLIGVFTDGDLRRLISEGEQSLSRQLKSVMTKKPSSISQDALAAEALREFSQRNIDDLIVVNSRKEPVGLVDLQDLPKLKLT